MISIKNENSGLKENPDAILDDDVVLEVDVAEEESVDERALFESRTGSFDLALC